MVEKILVYRDQKEVDLAMRDYRKAVTHCQRVVDFLKEYDVTIDLIQVKHLIKNNGDTDIFITPLNDIPKALRSMVETHNNELKEAFKAIATNARKAIFEKSMYPIDFSKLVLSDGIVSMSEETKQEAVDLCSIYIDTESRKRVYEKSLAVLQAVKDLEDELNNNPKQNLNGWRLQAISPHGSSFDVGLIKVGFDGKLELSGELFKYIV